MPGTLENNDLELRLGLKEYSACKARRHMFQLQHIHDTWWYRPASPEREVQAEACLIVSEGDLDYTRPCIVFWNLVFFHSVCNYHIFP